MSEIPIHYVELEAIYASTVARGIRSLAVTSANPGEGVTMLARALARRGAAAGLRTLLTDFNVFRPAVSRAVGSWQPNSASVRNAIVPLGDGCLDVLPASSLASSELAFRDAATLRRLLGDSLSDYDLIVADTSAVNTVNGRDVPAEAVAAACDAVVLVVLSGSTTGSAAKAAADRLRLAGATVAGVVMNDLGNPTLADELCRELRRVRRFMPRFADWLEPRLRRNALLRIQP